VDIVTGAAQDICDKPVPPVGGSWNRDGVIIFGSATTGLWRVSANGGTAVPLTHLDPVRQERQHQLPSFLPDGKHFLYLASSVDPAKSAIYAASLDDPPGKPPVRIFSTENGVQFVPAAGKGPAWLLFMRDGSLLAQLFDPTKLSLTGNPVPLPARVGLAYQGPLFAASPDLLAYRSGGQRNDVQLTWVDGKTGKPVGTAGEPGVITSFRLSPDETRVVYAKENADRRTDLWIVDLIRGGSTRLTFGGADYDFSRLVPG
jgi:eukaryotic-like serine/threonine-protein kinase